MVKKYELPNEMLQLIAAAPEIAVPMLQQRGEAQFATPDVRRSDLISALRSVAGPGNPGVTRFANGMNGTALKMGAYRGANNPGMLSIRKYVAPDVVLSGGETGTPYVKPDDFVFNDYVLDDEVIGDEVIDDEVIDDDVIDDEVIDDDVIGDIVEDRDIPSTDDGTGDGTGTEIIDGTGTQVTVDGGTGNDIIDGGTGNDIIDGGTDDDIISGLDLNASIAAILASRLSGTGTGGTGGGDGGSGTGGTGGLTGTGTTGGTGSTSTAGTTSGTGSTTGTGDSLRDAVVAAMGGSGASIDNSAAGLDMSSASSAAGSSLTADQLSQLTKPKVPSVTLEVVNGPIALDDKGSQSATYDYTEFLSPEELRAYEEWMKQSSGTGGSGAGKPVFDETAGTMEF